MKKRSDPRHQKRIKLIRNLFSLSFGKSFGPDTRIRDIASHFKKIDNLIARSAPDRPITQINRVDLSILRLAVYELVVEKSQPPKVIIDEAVELGKQFGSESSPAFINGALGKLLQIEGIKT